MPVPPSLLLALPLGMLGRFTNYANDTLALDDFTFITDFLDGGPYLHDPISPGK